MSHPLCDQFNIPRKFSAKCSLPTDQQRFSPLKVSHYTVINKINGYYNVDLLWHRSILCSIQLWKPATLYRETFDGENFCSLSATHDNFSMKLWGCLYDQFSILQKFLHEMLSFHQSAKMFSLESFPLHGT